uniref:non-specific serine/threonine protein kinase n=2 Tax=Clastoptera arizonana TaxID=38151 RepID=A0A1B6D4B8_9HEMI
MDKYEVVGLVGEGSFGRVFKANIRESKEIVALKVIRKCGRTQKEILSLRSECEIQRQLNHPNIIHMIDSFETESEIIVVTEFCQKDLHKILRKEGYLKEDQALGIVIDLVSALHYLHSHRVLHRDLKPQNVLLDENGVAKLCDFGFARSMSRGTHVLTSIKGTPLYMAPELIEEHPYDHNADLWSLGCIVYEMLIGVPPFITNSILHLVRLIRNEPIKWPNFLSSSCQDFLKGLLQKDPRQRLTWPYLHQHPFLQGKVFVDENICMPVPLTSELTNSQALAKENQKQEIILRSTAQNVKLLPCSVHAIEEQQRRLVAEQRRNGRRASLQTNNYVTHSNQGYSVTPRGYSVGSLSLVTYPFNVERANCITGVRHYGAQKVFNADELKIEKLTLEEPKCRCVPFESNAKTNDQIQKSENINENPKTVGVASLAEMFPNEPTLTTTPLETEEWLVFLQQSMEEVFEGDLESIRDKSFISMVTAPLTNPGASSQVIEYIACLLSLPYVEDHVSPAELRQIQQVYLEGKVIASLMFALKLLTSNLDYSASGDSFVDVSELGDDQLQALESVSLATSYFVYADLAFLSQFCDVVSMLHLELRLQALITLRRKRINIVTNFVAVLCHILKELPENASLVEEIVLTSQSPGEELHHMLTNENSILRSRSCMLLRLMGRFCCKSLRVFWNKELKNDLETLMYDSCQKVRSVCILSNNK